MAIKLKGGWAISVRTNHAHRVEPSEAVEP